MRKRCVLPALLGLILVSSSINATGFSPDNANFTFTIDASTGNVTFTNTSAIGNEPGERRALWTFGDGTSQWTGGLEGTQHHYTAPGTYNACLKLYRVNLTTQDSIVSSEVCKTIIIESSCQASFETLSANATSLGKYFVAQPSSSQNKRAVLICWNFGDNHDTCIQYAINYTGNYAVYHLYEQPGSYNVCVDIHYDGGCEAHTCHTIETSSPDSCHANFDVTLSTSTPFGRYFVAQPSHNHNKKPLEVCWNFGDNHDTCIQYSTSFTGPYAVYHRYLQQGNYNVCVTIHYDGGCIATNCHEVPVGETDSCRANFERIPFATANDVLSAAFRALTWNNHNHKPSRICWKFGDGADTCINYGQDYTGNYVVYHHYSHPGQFEVCVDITYYGGCEAHSCKIVSIETGTCSASIFEITSSANNTERNFYVAVNSVPQQPVVYICWRFGDGTDTCIVAPSATSPVPLTIHHHYPGPGVYQVCVRVVFAGGCVAETCREIVISSVNDACGGYVTDSLIGTRTYRFKGFAIHPPNDPVMTYHWTFGDGSAASGAEVTHTYSNAGEYRVCLTIVTQSGCETKICRTIRVIGENQTGLILSPNPVISILHTLFFSTRNETMTIKIINSTGVAVRTYSRSATIGANNWDFDLSTLTPGPYLCTVQSPNQLASALFLKE